MKTLKKLDEKPLPMQDDVPQEILDGFPTFRKMLKAVAGSSIPRSGDESIDLVQIGLKLKMQGDVSLEDAEFKLLKDKTNENPLKWESNFLGQVYALLKEAEK